MKPTWLRRLTRRWFPCENSIDKRANGYASKEHRTVRLWLEQLEDRIVPANVFWDGGAGTLNWNDAENWSEDMLPAVGDDVTINVAGDVTITHASGNTVINSLTSHESINLSGGSITLGASSTIHGAFDNAGALDVQSGSLSLLGGGSSSSGSFTVAAGAELVFSGTHLLSSTSSISGTGAVVFSGSNTTVAGTYDLTGATLVGNNANIVFTGSVLNTGALTVTGIADFRGAGSITLSSLTLSGTLTGTTDLIVSGQFTWSAGTLSGSGAVDANGGLDINGPVTLAGRVLNNAGTALWSAGNLSFADGATFNNLAGASFLTLHNQSLVSSGGAMSTFDNAGTFTKAGGTSLTNSGIIFNNNGTVEVQAGTLNLGHGGTHTGSFNVAAGSTLNFNIPRHIGGAHTLTGDVSGAGTVRFDNGAVNLDGGVYNVSGVTDVHRGTANFNAGVSVQSLGAVSISSLALPGVGPGVLNLSSDQEVTATSLNLERGGLTGSAVVTVTGLTTWSGGSMGGTGVLNFNGGLQISGDGQVGQRTLNNAGAAVWSGTGNIGFNSGATFNNLPGASFDLQNSGQFFAVDSAGTFNNAGALTKSAGNNTVFSGIVFNNSGAVEVQTGSLGLEGGGTSSGSFGVNAAAGLVLGGAHTLDASSSLTSAGAVRFAGTTALDGTNQLTGSIEIAGLVDFNTGAYDLTSTRVDGVGNFNSGVTVSSLGAVSIKGILNLSSGGPVHASTLDIVWRNTGDGAGGGTLTGPDTLTVTGLTTWTGGVMSGTGVTNANGGMILSTNSHITLNQRTLNNAGAAVWRDGLFGRDFRFNNGAVFNNLAGATFDVQNDRFLGFTAGAAGGVFNNAGAFIKSAGTSGGSGGTFGSTFTSVAFNNTGTVQVQAGTLSLSFGGASSGNFTVADGAILDFAGTHLITGDIAGPGAITSFQVPRHTRPIPVINFNGGVYNVTGVTLVRGSFNFNPGVTVQSLGDLIVEGGALDLSSGQVITVPTLNLTGGLTGSDVLSVTGLTTWSGGTMSGTGVTNAIGGLVGGGHLTQRTFNNAGPAVWRTLGANVTLNWNSAVFNNLSGATLEIKNDHSFVINSSMSTFNNAGTLIKSDGSGTISSNIIFNNSGTVEVQRGTLSLAGGGTHTGDFHIGSGATLTFADQVHDLTQANFQGTGTLAFSNIGTSSAPQLLEVPSQDVGESPAAFSGGFSLGALVLSGNSHVRLVDIVDNSSGAEAEALYVNSLSVAAGSTLDLNLHHLYARQTGISGAILGGSINQPPDGGPLFLNTPTPGTISTVGEFDEWAFFGWAGRVVTVLVNPGTTAVPAPLAPTLNFGEVHLLHPDGTLLASAAGTTSGQLVSLLGVELPVDGNYRIQVKATPGQPTNVGNYMLTAWDATVDTAPLLLNQQTTGVLENPFNVDRWTFFAPANTQVQFDLTNASSAAIQFQLTGPNGFVGFSALAADSGLVTLPADGTYLLEASSGGSLAGSYAFRLVETSQTDLPLGTVHTGTLLGSGQAQLFRIEITDDNPLLISLDDSSDSNRTEIYIGLDAPPTRRDFDYRSPQPGADHIITIPLATPGAWYVLVYAADVPAASSFSLRAVSTPLIVSSVTPDTYTADETATVVIRGSGFLPGTQVELAAGSATLFPQSVSVDSFEQLTAVFDFTAVPSGAYDLRVSLPGGATDTVPAAFDITAAGEAKLETRVIAPRSLRPLSTATLYVEYANTGTAAMPAPILILWPFIPGLASADGQGGIPPRDAGLVSLNASRLVEGFWTSSEEPAGWAPSLQLYASGATPGILLPGETIRVPVYFISRTGAIGDDIVFSLSVHDADNPDPVDWNLQKDSLKPSWIGDDAWDAVFANLTTQIGPTWGDYVRMLSDNTTYLGRLGLNVTDVNQLYSFEVQQAIGLSPVPVLASAADAALPAAGLPLQFDRSFGNTILERHHLGPFGRGWNAPSQVSLEELPDGTVIVEAEHFERRFEPDTRRAGTYFSQPADTGTLRQVADGAYELTEANGLVTRFRADGSLEYIEDVNGNRITAGFTDGLLTSLSHSNGSALTITWNAAARIASIADSAGRTTTYSYDPTNEHLLSVTGPAGTTSYTYSIGNGAAREHALLSVTDPSGVTEFFEYDNRGRLSATFFTGNRERINYAYDAAGRVTVTNALGEATHLFFDHRGLIVRTEDSQGVYSRFEYNDARQLIREANSLGQSRSYVWHGSGQLESATDQFGRTSRFTLGGPNNQPTAFIDANGNTTRYGYDLAGNLTSTTHADGSVERIAYDALGNPTSLVNRRGQAISLEYNAAGQVTLETFPDGSTNSYEYDTAGRLLSVASSTQGTTTIAYDAADRLLRVDYPNGRWLEYAYDPAGRRVRMEDHSGFVVSYSYDAAGRLSELRDGAGAMIVAYTYDAAGRLSREDKGNGTFTLYGYDTNGRILSIDHRAPDGSLNSQFIYTYDLLGRRTGMETLDGAWIYTYDMTGQLTRAVFVSTNPDIPDQDLNYEYDALGNRVRTILNGVSAEYTTNNLNQYTAAGATTFDYDLDGNLILEVSQDGARQYTYDALNRLVGVETPDGTWEYEYDAFGNRTATIVDGERTEYLLDLTGMVDVVAEYDRSGVRTVSYVHGNGLEAATRSGDWYHYDFDALGSAAGISGTAGSYVSAYSYEPFGARLFAHETVANPWSFVGQWGVRTVIDGPLLMGARAYSPPQGRFLSPDPLRLEAGDANLYRYSFNNPISLIDPSGKSTTSVILCVAAGVIIGSKSPPVGLLIIFICGGVELKGDPPPPTPPSDPADETRSRIERPRDPNDKHGAAGFGDEAFISAGTLIPYRINFENLGSGSDPVPSQPATVPAQRVEITDQLSEDLDWNTFQFTHFGFGDNFVTVPAGQQYYSTTVAMTQNDKTFDVEVELSFDFAAGQVRTVFQSIEPGTELPPDVFTGFLPPEDGTGIGQGHIAFTIMPSANLPTGAEIRNIAFIRFDSEPIIATNQVDPQDPSKGTDPDLEALNTIDAVAPTSSVGPLPEISESTFTISWSGADDIGGSGIAFYDIFVSADDGPFTPFLQNTTDTSATFTGQSGRRYSFFSVATDNVGHRELAPDQADATTFVIDNVPPVVELGPDVEIDEGSTLSVGGSFTDDDPGSWTATVDYGDGSGPQPLTLAPDKSFLLDHAYADDGEYTVTVTVTDDGEATGTDTLEVFVRNVVPTATMSDNGPVTYGNSFTVSLINPSDPSSTDTDAGLHYAFNLTGDFTGVTYATQSAAASANFTQNAGTYTVFARIIDKDDGFTEYQTEVTVNSATLTVEADHQTKVYGDDDPALTFDVSGFQFSDDESILTGGLTRVAGEDVGSYDIGQGNLAAGDNYVIDFTGHNLVIAPATLTVTADHQTKIFGDADPALTFVVTGFQLGDDASILTGALSRVPGENAGFYPIGQGNLTAGDNYVIDFTGHDLEITPAPWIALGADSEGAPHVRVVNPSTGQVVFSFLAYDVSFRGGVRIAIGDVNGDHTPDIITAPGPGGGPHIKVFDGITGNMIRSFFAYDPTFTGGVYVAAGDVNGDGRSDIITGAGASGGPHVKVFDGRTAGTLRDFFAYDPSFTGGVRVAAGDINRDGRTDIITGAGPGGGPHVRVFSGADGNVLRDWMALPPNVTSGVYVAGGDVNGDGFDDVIVSGHIAAPANIYDGMSGRLFASFMPFPMEPRMANAFSAPVPSNFGAVRTATTDLNGDGRDEIFTSLGAGFESEVRMFDGITVHELDRFFAFEPGFFGGVFVAGE